MTQLTIKTSVQKEVEKKIMLPGFWKENGHHKYLAAINEKTCIQFYVSKDGEYTSMLHTTCEFSSRAISEAHTNWLPVDESEFLMHYNDAHDSIRMEPLLIDTGSHQAYMEFMKTQNF